MSDTALAWSSIREEADWPGTEHLLSRFIRLASADAAEMNEFAQFYGVPELCYMHGRPDRHGRRDELRGYCPLLNDSGTPTVKTSSVRNAARAVAAIQKLGTSLAARQDGEPDDWSDLQGFAGPCPWQRGAWQRNRKVLAEAITRLLNDAGVAPIARWDRPRLTVTSEADGLLGVILVLLAREVGQGDRWTCNVCGAPVDRVRPPRSGEGVYCEKAACRREQQRRNQAKWRARKRAGGGRG